MPRGVSFLDWSRPALPQVVARLCERAEADGFVDLSNMIVVTPGGRAGRRFLEILAEQTGGKNAAPRMATPGDFPELLYHARLPMAEELVQHFAWVRALQGLQEHELKCILGNPPDLDDIDAWLALGRLISRVHRELAADQSDFSQVAALPAIQAAREQHRWRALAAAQASYLRQLDELGVWDRQTARLEAVRRKEPATTCDIVLIGLADMNRTLRGMLEQIADRVQVFIHAPESLANRFDSFGILNVDTWENARIDIDDELIQFATRPQDQAACVVDFIRDRSLAGDAIEDVVVGLADDQLASPVRVLLEERGVKSRWIGGRVAAQTSTYRLMQALAERLSSDSVTVSTALIRHPDVCRWLDGKGLPGDWLKQVDQAVIDHAPRVLGGGQGDEKDKALPVSRSVAEIIGNWLAPLQGEDRPLGEWAGLICQVVGELYEGGAFDFAVESSRYSAQVLEWIRDALVAQSNVPECLLPLASAGTAIRLALDTVAGKELTPDATPDSLEMLGWLELALDDAPSLIVCGFNEGMVPSSLNSDLFLPNGLREQLGLEDNRRRYARDAYALSVLLACRKQLKIVVGRQSAVGDPLLPSRLLFTGETRSVAERVMSAFDHQASPTLHVPTGLVEFSGLKVPRPRSGKVPEKLSVTAFRDYIACPYRFYLKYVEDLERVDEQGGELAANSFGTLIHNALEKWAEGPAVEATSEDEIRAAVLDGFQQAVDAMFDSSPLPVVTLQLELARQRLRKFAEWQAQHIRAGWNVRFIEQKTSWQLSLPEGKSLLLNGKIDRIDYHRERGEWMILDYKTGDGGKSPRDVHLKRGQWVDLQLPLYRFLARDLGVDGQITLAYLAMGKDTTKDIFQQAVWSEEELKEADREIMRVASHVVAGEYWPPSAAPPHFDDFPRLVQEGVFGREDFV